MPKIGLSVLFPAGSILTESAFVRESQGRLAADRCLFKRREGEKGVTGRLTATGLCLVDTCLTRGIISLSERVATEL